MDCDAQLAANKLLSLHAHFFRRVMLTRKVGHAELVVGVRSGLQDYTSLCARCGATISSTLVDIQTDVHTHRQTF